MIEEKDKEFSIYEVPLSLVDNRLDELIVEKLGLQRPSRSTSTTGASCCSDLRNPEHEVSIAVVGKYVEHHDAYKSIYEVARPRRHSPRRARCASAGFEARRSNAKGAERLLSGLDGILVPGGFGERGIEGKIEAIRYARERRHSVLRHLPGHAVRRDRVRPQRASAWTTPTRPSSTRTRRTR